MGALGLCLVVLLLAVAMWRLGFLARLARWFAIPGRRLVALMTCVALIFLSACATVRPVVDRIVDCSVATGKANYQGVLDEVRAALATGDYMTLLGNLAMTVGKDLVICAVRQVGAKASAAPGAATDPVAAHARAYLEAEGAR